MNSTDEIRPKSDTPGFSDFPGLHYILTICIVLLVCDVYSGGRTYSCLSRGNDYGCTYDVDKLQVMGGGVTVSQTFLILDSLLITLLRDLLLLPLSLITFAPVYLAATYISRRCHIGRNLTGVVFWIVAWTMAALTLPLIFEANSIFDPGHVSWRADILMLLMSGAAGVFCGTVYCLLAFRFRARLTVPADHLA
jgi:hypothetical protein